MNKKEFLEKLEKRLSILTDEEVEDILTEYGGYIDEKIKKKKMTEEDAIKSFGDFDELVKEILSAYKINDKKTSAGNFDNFFENIGSTVEGFVNNLSGKDSSEIIRVIVEIILILCIVGLFRIPLEVLVNLGDSIFEILPGPLDSILRGIWRFVFEISYLILSVIFIVKVIKERYIKESFNPVVKETPIRKETKKPVVKEEVQETKKEESATDIILKVISGIFKVFLAFMLIPGFGMLIALIIAACICISLFTSGVFFPGIFICVIALLMFAILMIEIVIKFIFDKRNSATKVLVSVLIIIFMLSIGISFTVTEVAKSSFINEVPKNYTEKLIEETIDATNYDKIVNWYNVEFVEVDNLGNNIKIEVRYYENFSNPVILKRSNYIEIDYYNRIRYSGKELYNIIVEDLKEKEFHNYAKLFEPQITVYASRTLIEKYEKYYYDEHSEYLEKEIDRLEEEVDYWKERYEEKYDNDCLNEYHNDDF